MYFLMKSLTFREQKCYDIYFFRAALFDYTNDKITVTTKEYSPTNFSHATKKKKKAGYNSPANNNYLHNLLAVRIIDMIAFSSLLHAILSPGEIIICSTL